MLACVSQPKIMIISVWPHYSLTSYQTEKSDVHFRKKNMWMIRMRSKRPSIELNINLKTSMKNLNFWIWEVTLCLWLLSWVSALAVVFEVIIYYYPATVWFHTKVWCEHVSFPRNELIWFNLVIRFGLDSTQPSVQAKLDWCDHVFQLLCVCNLLA